MRVDTVDEDALRQAIDLARQARAAAEAEAVGVTLPQRRRVRTYFGGPIDSVVSTWKRRKEE